VAAWAVEWAVAVQVEICREAVVAVGTVELLASEIIRLKKLPSNKNLYWLKINPSIKHYPYHRIINIKKAPCLRKEPFYIVTENLSF